MNHDLTIRHRGDVPAALPLLLTISGLAAGPLLLHPRAAAAGFATAALLLLAAATRRASDPLRAGAVALLFLAGGVLLALRSANVEREEHRAFAALDPDVFATIEAPIERDWSPRDGSFVLRASRFSAGGRQFDAPIAIYVRFPPPPIAMQASVRVEAPLRKSEHGYSVSVKSPRLLEYTGQIAAWHPAAWNRALAQRLAPHAREYPDEVALAEALALGRGERLTEEMRESFRGGGTYHLLVFSGLQIAIAAAMLAALLRWLHAPRAADWLLLAFALLAPSFIGPTASVSRASVAIGLYAVSRIARRPTSIENLWCVAALLRLAFVPGDLTDPSFHLTYAGAGALLFIGRHARAGPPPGKIASAARFAAAVEVSIAPLTLFHFHQVTLGGSLVTMAMSPLILAMLLVSIAACAYPAGPFFAAIAALHRLCDFLNAAGLSGPFAAPPLAAILVGSFLALTALALLRGGARSLAIALALLIPSGAAIVRSASRASVATPRVTFFDVGQGDAIAIRSGAHTVLVDGGPGRRLLPLLADRGIRSIDLALLTHAHPDHCEGLAAAIRELDVRQVWVSPRRFRGECAARLIDAARSSSTPIHLLRDGARLAAGGLRLEAFTAGMTFRKAPENNASVVLRVTAGGRRFLLTGDIESEAELYLADQDLRADVLKVAHHGSRSSTSTSLLDNVAPRVAVISCGRANPFGHPHPAVLSRIEKARARIWRTDRHGSIDVEIDRGKLYVHPSFD